MYFAKYCNFFIVGYNKNRNLIENKLQDTREKLANTILELHNARSELQEKEYKLMYNQMQLGITEEKYKLIVEASNDGIWDYDFIKNKRFQSQRFFEKLVYKVEDLNDQEDWNKLIHTRVYF